MPDRHAQLDGRHNSGCWARVEPAGSGRLAVGVPWRGGYAKMPACPALAPGTVLIQQGGSGDAYYAIAAGELDVQHDGHFLRRCGRGEGVGEIALLRDMPRTATVTAHSAATVYELHRDLFLTAVPGHAPTQRQANRIADARLATGGAPGNGHNQGPDAPEPG